MNKLIWILCMISLILTKCEDTIEKVGSRFSTESSNPSPSKAKRQQNSKIKYSDNAKVSKFIDERRIYLIDLTRSMEGFNGSEDIFENVKDQLRQTITAINDTSTEIFLVPFTDQVKGQFNTSIANKDSILNYIDGLKTMKGDTNILDAWKKGVELLDSTKINYMFMLTDGIHNAGEPSDSLYNELREWHLHTAGKYQFAFYVLLSEAANEQEVCRIVENSKQMWLVPSMSLQADFIVGNMNQSVNIINSNKVKMHLACTNPEIFNQGFKFNISIPKNEYYEIINAVKVLDADGNLQFEIKKLKPQKDLPISYKTQINISYNQAKYPFIFFTPEEYNLNIVNVGTRQMIIKNLKK